MVVLQINLFANLDILNGIKQSSIKFSNWNVLKEGLVAWDKI